MPENERLTITVEQAAKQAGISRALGYDQARRGLWPVIRCGRRLLISRHMFALYLNGQWKPPAGNGNAQ